MGSGQSGPTYKPEVNKYAEQFNLGKETMNAIYDKFLMASQNSKDSIPVDVFLRLFPFTTQLAREGIKRYCLVEEDKGCNVEGFVKLFAALDPKYTNKELGNIIFEVFKTDSGLFDLKTFFTELKANLLFSYKGSENGLKEYINGSLENEKANELETLTKKQFDRLTEKPSSYILLYGKQLLFGSFIFQ